MQDTKRSKSRWAIFTLSAFLAAIPPALLIGTAAHAQDEPETTSVSGTGGSAPYSLGFVMKFVEIADGEVSDGPNFRVRKVDVAVEDPAGHGCCIQEPPETMSVTFDSWSSLTLGDSEAGGPAYLPIENITVSQYGTLSGEKISTVAGFTNVRTTLSGQITREGIDLDISVGADGGLPSSQPIRFNYQSRFESNTQLSSISNPVLNLQTGRNSAEVRDWLIDPEIQQGFELYASLFTELTDMVVDWFIVLLSPNGDMASFNLQSGQFEPGVAPTFQGPIQNIDPTLLLRLAEPPAADSIIAFGVDAQDGQLNGDIEYSAIQIKHASGN